MNSKMKLLIKRLSRTRLEPLFRAVFNLVCKIEYDIINLSRRLKYGRQTSEDVRLVCENVTFIFKSFERQGYAVKLYKNIRRYYPTAKIVIADDSEAPLKIADEPNLTLIRLPFNSGLSRGLNKAIECVTTPYVMRMDDDELLLSSSGVERELKFLMNHREVDLSGFMFTAPPKCRRTKTLIPIYAKFTMSGAEESFIIPHMTSIDETHIVMGKVPNIWLARTEKIREIGWDDNIRMIDHHEFFHRCVGKLVSVIAVDTIVWHRHNPFDAHYHNYRSDIKNDGLYIYKKHGRNYYK